MNEKNMITHDSSPRYEANSSVNEVFKRIDLLIRNGEIKRAQEELKKANEIRKKSLQKAPFSVLTNKNCVFPETPLPPKPIDAMMTSIKQANSTVNRASYPIENASVEKSKSAKQEHPADRKIELNSYREALYDAWRDGALTESESRQLQELRALLEVSNIEHLMIEREIKLKCYKEAVSNYLSKTPTTQFDEKTILMLQKTFQVAEKERAQIQTQFINQAKQKNHRDKILIIDDEIPFLKLVAASIIEDGFDVVAVPTSDEAYLFLKQQAPDLILCDINLKSSSMNGFILHSKIQDIKYLQHVPFIFITGLANEEILRNIKEIGADDCLVKPFSKQALISTIRGKLKRFKQLKSLSV